MKVNKLINKFIINNHKINSLKTDSRKVVEGDIFYAIKGSDFDGNNYINEAILRGAKTIISEVELKDKSEYSNINYIVVDDVRKELAMNAKVFYKDISRTMDLIGVTGTNGKTTVTTLLYKYLMKLNKKATLIGTNGIYIDNIYYETKNTTPDILDIYEILEMSKESGVSTVFMEVSSHAIKMLRVYGLEFKIGLITNISLDHLDYHRTMDDYKYTKGLFLSHIDKNNIVIINKDMDDFIFFNKLPQAKVSTFGSENCDYKLIDYTLGIEGSSFKINIKGIEYKLETKLLGLFNIFNILAFIAIIDCLKMPLDNINSFINSKINILGRMEVIEYKNRYFVIDFAHTPDGVENVIKYLNQIKKNNLIVIIGCGGDRDRSKRRVIGDIVSREADYFVLTNDNPRTEDPVLIIEDILEGVKTKNYAVIMDRKIAIEEAYKRSLKDDIIAILGKGNEEYQIINNQKIMFSDKEVVRGLNL